MDFSIIIPHKNIPNLLERCLRTIPVRNDVEVIVVDDNSAPAVLKSLYKIEENFKRVKFVYLSTGGGGGKARNIGLESASGKYLIFADADDFFEDNFSSILDEYKEKEFDLAFFKGTSCDTDTYELTHRADHLNRYVDMYLQGVDKEANHLRYFFGEPWCKIIKRELVNEFNIKYDETKIHNDTTFGYLIGYHAEKVIVDRRPLYCVTTRKGSVSVTVSDDRILTRVNVYGRAELFFKEKRIPIFIDGHYVQLVRLLVHCRISLFNQCVAELKTLGLSSLHIFKNIITTFLNLMIKRTR